MVMAILSIPIVINIVEHIITQAITTIGDIILMAITPHITIMTITGNFYRIKKYGIIPRLTNEELSRSEY